MAGTKYSKNILKILLRTYASHCLINFSMYLRITPPPPGPPGDLILIPPPQLILYTALFTYKGLERIVRRCQTFIHSCCGQQDHQKFVR